MRNYYKLQRNKAERAQGRLKHTLSDMFYVQRYIYLLITVSICICGIKRKCAKTGILKDRDRSIRGSVKNK